MTQTNLKPFDLQAALAGKPVVTRDGRAVKIAGYNVNAKEAEDALLGWANDVPKQWNANGKWLSDSENPADLFMAPEKREVWVCYWKKDGYEEFNASESKEKAELEAIAAKGIIVTTVKIWEEEI